MTINKNWTFTKTSIGPEKWDKKYSTCNTSYQSPINIITRNAVRCEMECNIEFQYFPGKCNVKCMVNQLKNDENTKSIIFFLDYQSGSYIKFNEVTYILQTVHFYPGGLHNIDNGKYDMEAVLSHTDESGNILNISVLISKSTDFGDSQNFFSQLSSNISRLSKDTEVNNQQLKTLMEGNAVSYSVDENWSINNFLPINRSFYYYLGSSIYPPCDSNIKWIILKESVDVLYNDMIPFIEYANKKFEGNDGQLYSESMRNIQPNPSFVSGKKVERIIYENNNSNNGNIKKEKIYIKCQKIKKSNSSNTESNSNSNSSNNVGFDGMGFFNSTAWSILKNLCFISLYIIAVVGAYKFVSWLYTSGKLIEFEKNFSVGEHLMEGVSLTEFKSNIITPTKSPSLDGNTIPNLNKYVEFDKKIYDLVSNTGKEINIFTGGGVKKMNIGSGNLNDYI